MIEQIDITPSTGVYGTYIGESLNDLLHYSDSECFYQIRREDMVFFMLISKEEILELGYYECPICFPN